MLQTTVRLLLPLFGSGTSGPLPHALAASLVHQTNAVVLQYLPVILLFDQLSQSNILFATEYGPRTSRSAISIGPLFRS